MPSSLGNSGLQPCCFRGKGRIITLNVVYVAVGYRSMLMKEDAVIRNVDAMSRIVNTYVLT